MAYADLLHSGIGVLTMFLLYPFQALSLVYPLLAPGAGEMGGRLP